MVQKNIWVMKYGCVRLKSIVVSQLGNTAGVDTTSQGCSCFVEFVVTCAFCILYQVLNAYNILGKMKTRP